jgi:hypothetical protein
MEKNNEKYNAATMCGWKVLRYTGRQLDEPHEVFEQLCYALGVFDGEPNDD